MKKAGLLVAVFALICSTGFVQAGEDSNLIPNRLSFARVGEWAQYQLPDGYTQRLTVAKRFGEGPDAMVTILVENIYDGKVVTAQEITEMAGEPFTSPRVPATKGVLVAIKNDTVPFKGKDVPVSVVEINKNLGTEDAEVIEYHTHSEVPVFGIFKKIENGEVVWKLDDFGQGDGSFHRSPEVEKAMKEAHETKIKAAATADKSISEIKQKAEEALKKAEGTNKTLTDQAKSAASAASAALGAAAGAVSGTAGKAVDAVSDSAGKAVDAVSDTAGKAVDATADATEKAVDKAVEAIKGAAGTATDTVGGLIDRAKDAISDTAKAAGKVIGDATDKVTKEVKSEVKAVGEALSKTEDEAKTTAREEAEALDKAVQKIKTM